MKELYSNVCNKIIKYYSNSLVENEFDIIKNGINSNRYDESFVIFINKIIDRIWNNTLTNPKDYDSKKSFCFLTTRDVIPNGYNLDEVSNLSKLRNHDLELITDETITDSVAGLYGFVVNIDYISCFSEPLLPIDFQEKKELIANVKFNVLGLYSISFGLDEFDLCERSINSFANSIKVNSVNINKPMHNFYKKNIILSKNDKDMLAEFIILDYFSEIDINKINNFISLKNFLRDKYKNQIASLYLKFFEKKISLEIFTNQVTDLLDNEKNFIESLINVDKKV